MSYENYVINGPPRKPTRIKVRHTGSLGGPGYTTKPATERHRLLWRHLEKHGYASTISALQSRINLGSRTMGKRALAAFESDKAWLQKEHEQMAKLTGAAKAAFKAKMAAGRKAAAKRNTKGGKKPRRNGPKAKRARRARAAESAAAEAEAEAAAARDLAAAFKGSQKSGGFVEGIAVGSSARLAASKKKAAAAKKRKAAAAKKRLASKKKATKKKATKKKATKKKATKKKSGKMTAAQRKAAAAKGAKTRKANEAKKKRAAAKSAKTRKANAAAAKKKKAAAKRKKAAPKKKTGRKKKRKQSSKKTECYARRVYLKEPTRGESAAGATLRRARGKAVKRQAAGVLATKMHKDYDCRQVERNYFDFSVPNSKLGG